MTDNQDRMAQALLAAKTEFDFLVQKRTFDVTDRERWRALANVIQAAIAHASAQPAQPASVADGWISVHDRVPTGDLEMEGVLVRYRYTNEPGRPWDVKESFYDSDYPENGGWCFGSCYYAEVSHWMPKSVLLAAPQPPSAMAQESGE